MSDIPQFTDDQLDEKLKRLFGMHQGKERAVKRWELVLSVYGFGADTPQNDHNLQDRAIRYSVERLRSHGWLICDLGNGRGRYLAVTEDEFREFRTYYLQPLRARARTIRHMEKAALEKWPNLLQLPLFDMDELRAVEMGDWAA